MRVTIELDTNDITEHDRRVLAALVSDDTAPLVLPIPGAGVEHTPAPAEHAGMPSPVPAPPGFMQRLGEATAQFGRSPGAAHEARLPVAQQAGVTTRSTMPDDDEPADVVDAGAVPPATTVARELVDGSNDVGDFESAVMHAVSEATLPPSAGRGSAHAHVPEPLDVHVDEPVLHIVAPPPPAHADRDRVRVVTPPYPEPAPVRYTTP